MRVVKRIAGLTVRLGGEQHSGWLPVGAAVPLPAPIRDVVMDFEIVFDGHGYLFCYVSSDGSTYGDTWHETIQLAENAAEESFGITPSQWQTAKPDAAADLP